MRRSHCKMKQNMQQDMDGRVEIILIIIITIPIVFIILIIMMSGLHPPSSWIRTPTGAMTTMHTGHC